MVRRVKSEFVGIFATDARTSGYSPPVQVESGTSIESGKQASRPVARREGNGDARFRRSIPRQKVGDGCLFACAKGAARLIGGAMQNLLVDYLPLVLFIGLSAVIGLALMVAPFVVAYQNPDPEKLSAYE